MLSSTHHHRQVEQSAVHHQLEVLWRSRPWNMELWGRNLKGVEACQLDNFINCYHRTGVCISLIRTYITLSHSGSDFPLATKTQWKHIYVAGTGNQDEMVRLPSSTKGPMSLRIYVCCLCGDGSCWAINDVIAHNICGVALYLLCQHPIVLQIYAHYDDMINHWPRKNFTFVCEHFLPRYKIRTNQMEVRLF